MRKKELAKQPKIPRQKKQKKPLKETLSDFLHNRVSIGIIVIIAAVLIGFVGAPAVRGLVSERVTVLTVSAIVPKGTLITEEMLETRTVGKVDLPPNAAIEPVQVVGTFAGTDFYPGDLITSNKLSKERPLANPYLYSLPQGKQAISTTVAGLAEGLTGKLKEGDIVSVYAVFNEGNTEDKYIGKQLPELKFVKVLAISNRSGHDIDVDAPLMEEDGQGEERLPETITLLVDERQAGILTGLNHNATLHVSLVARGEQTELSSSLLSAQDTYLKKLEKKEKENAKKEQKGDDTLFPEVGSPESSTSETKVAEPKTDTKEDSAKPQSTTDTPIEEESKNE